jgi:DNA-binding transcriptional regulator YdaS (Cro superfamily)
MDVLSKIDSHFKNQTELGLAVGVSQSVVSEWLTGKATIPPLRAKKIAELTGIPREEILPKVFG